MKCEIEKNKLHLFYDNQLHAEETNILSEHIMECKSCRKELDFLSQLKKQFSDMGYVQISPQLLLQLNQIGKSKSRSIKFLNDIFKITFNNKNGKFHIDKILEITLNEKYSEKIIRWVFFC